MSDLKKIKSQIELLEVKQQSYQLVGRCMDMGIPPTDIAAMMVQTALQIYKTMLIDQDYDKMVDYISESRDLVEPIHSGTIQ